MFEYINNSILKFTSGELTMFQYVFLWMCPYLVLGFAWEAKLRKNFFESLDDLVSHSQPQNRNEFCACGSGKKYKRCCGSDLIKIQRLTDNNTILISYAKKRFPVLYVIFLPFVLFENILINKAKPR